jgi:hypothetical protein
MRTSYVRHDPYTSGFSWQKKQELNMGPTPPTPWKNKRSADKTRNRTSPGAANKKRVARKKRRSAVLLIDETDEPSDHERGQQRHRYRSRHAPLINQVF